MPTTDPDLTDLLDHTWSHLVRATHTARHGLHLVTLATVTTGPEGLPSPAARPAARTVVLRRAMPEARTLIVHTDRRSDKVAEVHANFNVVACAYDPGSRLQFRATCHAFIEADTLLADEQWQRSSLSSRRCYLAPHAIGEALDAPHPNLPEGLRDRVPSAEESEPGRANFAIVKCVLEAMDVLELAADGHRRARYRWNDGDLSATWLAP